MGSPCGWSIENCGCGTCWADYSPATQDNAAALAIGLMWAATGRQFGLCEVTVMPHNPGRRDPLYQTFPASAPLGGEPGTLGIYPVLDSGTWRNLCGGGCSCRSTCQVLLDGPVASIVEVQVDGEVVDPAAYRVHDREALVRIDGTCWPVCTKVDTPIPGFEVTYERGSPIPDQVQAAVEVLACEYAKACANQACRLPKRLASLSRQGVEVTLAQVPDPGQGVLRTGIQVVDDAITAVNPWGLVERPMVWSPDQPTHPSITWWAGS